MPKGLLLAAVFVILLFTLYTPSVAYTDSSISQAGLLTSIGNAIKSVVTSVVNTVKAVVTTISNAISPPKTTPTTTTTTTQKPTTTTTTTTTTPTNKDSTDTTKKDTTGDGDKKDTPDDNTCKTNCGGGGGGGGSTIIDKAVDWFANLLKPPAPKQTALTATDVDFSGATPFDDKTGNQTKKENPIKGAVIGGLSALGGLFVAKLQSDVSAAKGLGKALYLNGKEEAKYQSSLWGAVAKGDLKGAAQIYIAKKTEEVNKLVNTVKEHANEIFFAFVVGVAVGVAIMTAGVGSPLSIAIIAAGAAYTGYALNKTYTPLLQNVDKACSLNGCGDGNKALDSLNDQARADVVIFGAGVAGGVVGGGAVGAMPKGAKLNVFSKGFESSEGPVKFSRGSLDHFTNEVRPGSPTLKNGLPNTRLNQVKGAMGVKTDGEVSSLIQQTLSTGQKQPYTSEITNYVKVFPDGTKMTVGVDAAGEIKTVIATT